MGITVNEDKAFLLQLRLRAEQKVKEYNELLHERQRIEMQLERTKEYIEKLNVFLTAEGLESVSVKSNTLNSPVGRPGNRSSKLPIRKVQWEGRTINEIINIILQGNPDMAFHPNQVVQMIYEIQSEADNKLVIRNIRSTMQRGARDGLWKKTGRAMFKAKADEIQSSFESVNNTVKPASSLA